MVGQLRVKVHVDDVRLVRQVLREGHIVELQGFAAGWYAQIVPEMEQMGAQFYDDATRTGQHFTKWGGRGRVSVTRRDPFGYTGDLVAIPEGFNLRGWVGWIARDITGGVLA